MNGLNYLCRLYHHHHHHHMLWNNMELCFFRIAGQNWSQNKVTSDLIISLVTLKTIICIFSTVKNTLHINKPNCILRKIGKLLAQSYVQWTWSVGAPSFQLCIFFIFSHFNYLRNKIATCFQLWLELGWLVLPLPKIFNFISFSDA
jgi:hypothetical protein